jgi:hypothetical protein
LRREVAQQLEEAFRESGIGKNESGRLTGMTNSPYEYLGGRRGVVAQGLLTLADALGYQVVVTLVKRPAAAK